MILLAHVITVIAGEHDDRVVGVWASLEFVEDLPHLIVHERNAGQIGLYPPSPVVVARRLDRFELSKPDRPF